MNIHSFFLVFVGSGLGGCLRFGLSHFIRDWLGSGFPLGTLAVNMLACFLAGFLVGRLLSFDSENLRFLMLIGFCGGFSTFSAFGVETLELIQKGNWSLALIYVVISVLVGIGAVCLGKIVA